jgi:hypothetical protein
LKSEPEADPGGPAKNGQFALLFSENAFPAGSE